MGNVKRHLFQAPLASSAPVMYPNKRSIEAAESYHLHERNVRLEWTPNEWFALIGALERAAKKRHETPPVKRTQWLDIEDIAQQPGMTPQRFEVEESFYPSLPETTIHLHYRNLRLEFTHEEWEEFAGGIAAALAEWNR